MQSSKWLVVALGNPLVGPDAFGAAVLARLRQLPGFDAVADGLDAGTDLLGHLDTLARYRRLLLIDAVLGTGSPGRVAVYEEERLSTGSPLSPGAHQVSPLLAVGLLRRLHPEGPSRIVLVGLSVDEVRMDMPPDESAVRSAVVAAVDVLGLHRS